MLEVTEGDKKPEPLVVGDSVGQAVVEALARLGGAILGGKEMAQPDLQSVVDLASAFSSVLVIDLKTGRVTGVGEPEKKKAEI